MLKHALDAKDIIALKCTSCRLKTCPIFSSLPEKELHEIEKIKQDLFLKKRSQVFLERNPNPGFYIIQSGLVKVYKSCRKGLDLAFRFAKPGDTLDLASYQREKNNASARCLSEARVCFFELKKFRAVLPAFPDLAFELLSRACHELGQTRNKALDIIAHPVESRFANFLLYLQDARLDVYLSREEMAQAVGCSLETLIRLVSQFRRKGVIKTRNKEISIVDPNALAELTKGRPGDMWR